MGRRHLSRPQNECHVPFHFVILAATVGTAISDNFSPPNSYAHTHTISENFRNKKEEEKFQLKMRRYELYLEALSAGVDFRVSPNTENRKPKTAIRVDNKKQKKKNTTKNNKTVYFMCRKQHLLTGKKI